MDSRRWIAWGAATLLTAACSGGDATPTTVAGTESPRPAGSSTPATPSPWTGHAGRTTDPHGGGYGTAVDIAAPATP